MLNKLANLPFVVEGVEFYREGQLVELRLKPATMGLLAELAEVITREQVQAIRETTNDPEAVQASATGSLLTLISEVFTSPKYQSWLLDRCSEIGKISHELTFGQYLLAVKDLLGRSGLTVPKVIPTEEPSTRETPTPISSPG